MKSYIMGIHGWVLGFEKKESFQFRIPYKDCGFKACFEKFLTSVFFRSCFLNLFPQILDKTFIVWNFETFSNFLSLTLKSFQDPSFFHHIPFKEVLRIDVFVWMHLHDFLAHLCTYLERNHVKLLWPKLQDFYDFDCVLFEISLVTLRCICTDLRTKLSKDRHENMESFQGSVMRSRAKKIDLEMERNKLRRV
ncbi:hypothetical protein M9H77_30192 [Catharanthus roseus]|uniref:Uncharacterized protein n=1 Tax=Catharanthus roseus TaxID=4058 RepID=A0ACB9ZWJ4_CATRO|nr:hypothetical protein M9H77_30192 [Catharanthus roseus]